MTENSPGLRHRQREKRRRQILFAAGKLFMDIGFDETTMEDIAREAVISVPTVYSYFASKNDLLFAIFETDEALIAPRIDGLLKNTPADPIDAIAEMVLAEIVDGYDVAQKRVWREISAAALRAVPERRTSFMELQHFRVEALERLLAILKSRRQIRDDLECWIAARAIYGVARNGFRMYVMSEDSTIADLAAQIRQDIGIIFAGIRA